MSDIPPLPSSRKGLQHLRVLVGIRDHKPGILMWILPAGTRTPILRGLGQNPELEQRAIEHTRFLASYGEEVPYTPARNSGTAVAGLNPPDFPHGVTAALMNSIPGQTEILRIDPPGAYEEILRAWEEYPLEDYAEDMTLQAQLIEAEELSKLISTIERD